MVAIGGDFVKLEDYKFVSWQINDGAPTRPMILQRSIVNDIDNISKPASAQLLIIHTGFSRSLYGASRFVFDRTDFKHFLFSDESRNRLWNWLNEWR